MKYETQYIKKKLPYGYVGMNYYAAKAKRFKWPHSKRNIIIIWEGLDSEAKFHTIQHEKLEMYLMKNKHYSYKKAHQLALKFEKKNEYFPSLHKRLFRKNNEKHKTGCKK
jgi:hypothetical protein